MKILVLALCFISALFASPIPPTWTGSPDITYSQCLGCQGNTPQPTVDELSGAYLDAYYANDALGDGGETVQDFSVPFFVSADANIEIEATLTYGASLNCGPEGCTGGSTPTDASVDFTDSIYVFDSSDNVILDLPLTGTTTGSLGTDAMSAEADLPAGNYTMAAFFGDSIHASGDSQVYAQLTFGAFDPPIAAPEPTGESMLMAFPLLGWYLVRRFARVDN